MIQRRSIGHRHGLEKSEIATMILKFQIPTVEIKK